MNNYLKKQIIKIKVTDDIKYLPLVDDHDIMNESFLLEFPKENQKCNVFNIGRRYLNLKKNKPFKIHRKNIELTNKKPRTKNVFSELQNKMQSLTTNIRKSIDRYRKANTVSNCVTPNRKIRCMLGRTPTKLYSPFSIETPKSDAQWRNQLAKQLENTPVGLYEWQTPKKKNQKIDKIKTKLPNIFKQ